MRRALIAMLAVAASLAAVLAAGAANTAGTKLEASLRGSNERPVAPASNRGTVELRLTARTGKVCWEFKLRKVDGKPNQAHIHKGGKGVAGNVVVPLGANYKRQGCTTASKARPPSRSDAGAKAVKVIGMCAAYSFPIASSG